MESNGEAGRIHISKATADLLTARGRSAWIQPREGMINAKGKGFIQTYWCRMSSKTKSLGTMSDRSDVSHYSEVQAEGQKRDRLIDWNSDVLAKCLKQIVAQRKAQGKKVSTAAIKRMEQKHAASYGMPFDEVCEVIQLPESASASTFQDTNVELDEKVIEQLRSFVSRIAACYNSNPFHSFDHASNVVASVKKLLSRIIDPRLEDVANGKSLTDHTFGLTAHPLSQFSIVLSALIHDVGE